MAGLVDTLLNSWRSSPAVRRYQALSSRERALVNVLVATVVAAVGYSLVASLVDFRQLAVARYLEEETDLAWMQDNRKKVGVGQGQGATRSDTLLSTVVRTTAIEFGFQPRRTQTEGDGVGVRIEAEAFDKVLRWAYALESRHGVEITNADIDVHSPGKVNARFSLR